MERGASTAVLLVVFLAIDATLGHPMLESEAAGGLVQLETQHQQEEGRDDPMQDLHKDAEPDPPPAGVEEKLEPPQEMDPANYTGMPGIPAPEPQRANSSESDVQPSPSPNPLTNKYRSLLKEDLCAYLYDLSNYLRPHWAPTDRIREELMAVSAKIPCFVEGEGPNHLKADLYRPKLGDHGPWPNSGFPYVLHALVSDKRNVAVMVKYDDPTKTGLDLYKAIGDQLGLRPDQFSVYFRSHPVTHATRLDTLGLKFQDTLHVDFDKTNFKPDTNPEEVSKTIEGRFYHHTGDTQRSLHGPEP